MSKYYSEEAHKQFSDRGLTPQPLYWLAENNECTFNTTKLSELPNAIKRGPTELKHLYKVSLTNPMFITAKFSAGLGREMLGEYATATLGRPSDFSNLLNNYKEFITQNIHVLEKEPHLILQQVENMSQKPEALQKNLEGLDLEGILPWRNDQTLGAPCTLVNKPEGQNPCFITTSGQEVEGNIYGLDVVGVDDEDGYLVIGSTHKNQDPKDKFKHPYVGKIDIYDGLTLQCMLSVACDHSVHSLKIFRSSPESFCIVYNSLDYQLRTINVCLEEVPKATHGISLSLETKSIHSKAPRYQTVLRPPLGRNTFAISKDGRVAGSAHGQIASRGTIHYCTKPDFTRKIKRSIPRKYYSSVFKLWDLDEAISALEDDESLDSPQPIIEIEPVLASLVEPDPEQSEKNSHPGGYYVSNIAFSPDDQFIVIVLLAEDDGETYSPFMSICDSHTMQNLWAINNVIGLNIVSDLDHDQWYWLSCLKAEKDKWFITFASVRAVTCIAVYSKDPKNIQAKRIWGKWKDGNITEATFCQLNPEEGDKFRVLVTHPKGIMEMRYEPEIDLGDPNNWKEDEKKSELTEFCRKRVFNPYHTKLPESLPCWKERLPLPDLGSEIQRMFTDTADSGILVTVSKLGEIKITDLSRYLNFKTPERHEDAVLCCSVSPNHRYVCTGTKRGSIGVWNSTSGAMIAIHEKPMPSLTPASAVAVTSDGEFIVCMQSNQIHFFRSKNLVDYDKNSKKKVYDVHDMLLYTSRFRKDSSPVYTNTDDVDLSPDAKLVCAPHPLEGALDIVVGQIKACPQRNSQTDPPACLVKVHAVKKKIKFHDNYRARFSLDGKYLAAYGSIYTYAKSELSDDEWPPQIKLFEMLQWDEWKEVSIYRFAPKSNNPQSLKPRPDPGCSSMAFLSDNTLAVVLWLSCQIISIWYLVLIMVWSSSIVYQI